MAKIITLIGLATGVLSVNARFQQLTALCDCETYTFIPRIYSLVIAHSRQRVPASKTNPLFFSKGKKTEKIWYYDLSHVKVGKKTPLTLAHFGLEVGQCCPLPCARIC